MPTNKKRLSEILSWVLHPIVLPLVFTLLILSGDYYINSFLRPEAYRIIIVAVIIFTLMIPAAIFTVSRYLGIIESFDMVSKLERLFAITVIGLSSFFCRKILSGFELPSYYTDFLTIIVIGSALALLISLFQKFSLHVFGWSILFFSLIWYAVMFQSFDIVLIPITAILAGVVGTARLGCSAHKPAELYIGFGVGFLPVLILWFL